MSKVEIKMNTKAVQRAVDRSAPNTLSRAGAYLRAIARNSIKRRKNPNKSSQPGTPPYHHSSFKNTIQWGLSPDRQTVYIGPAIVRGGMMNAGRLHEFGGVKSFANKFKGYKLGQTGPIAENADGSLRRIRLRTPGQVARANRLARQHTPWLLGGVRRYPARPFMRPALLAGLPKLSNFWINAITP